MTKGTNTRVRVHGKVDNLHISYDGNRIKTVIEDADPVTQNGSMDYPGGKKELEFTYNDWGALVSDPSRGITDITYDNFGNPLRISFSDGGSTEKDYLGNNRAVINDTSGEIEQTIAYYPYGGVIADLGTPTTGQPYKFGGKELITANGLNEYDFGARRYYQAIPHFTSIDPLCEDTKHLSPYLYCGNNPVNAFDPDGRSTWVTDIGNGMYQVIGGDLNDNDLNIYEYKKDKNGNYTVRGKAIGQTTSMTSFFDSDYEDGEGRWMDKSVIDTTDGSGEQFMYNLVSDSPRLLEYMNKARNGHEYDFKVTNGNPQENPTLDPYRGMPFGFTEAGNPIYTSARDIGNIAAGYVAARYKLPWWFSRAGFDSYQVMKSLKFKKEGKSTINAERYGYDCVKNGLPIFNKPVRSFRIFE